MPNPTFFPFLKKQPEKNHVANYISSSLADDFPLAICHAATTESSSFHFIRITYSDIMRLPLPRGGAVCKCVGARVPMKIAHAPLSDSALGNAFRRFIQLTIVSICISSLCTISQYIIVLL